jgi:hypothetical protein
MKEFERWFKKHKPYEAYSCMDMAEKAWKAAFELIRETHENHSITEVLRLVGEELGNDN